MRARTVSNAAGLWDAATGPAPRLSDMAGRRENHFNLMRMGLATGVLVSHAFPLALGPGAAQPLEGLLGANLGTLCVYVFFALSGFFIAQSFDRSRCGLHFLAARALRLFPALAVMSCLTVIAAALWVSAADPAAVWREGAAYVLRSMTLVAVDYTLPGVFQDTPYPGVINGSLWTLFYEVVCYLGVLVLGLLGLFRHPRLCAGVVALAAGLCGAVWLAAAAGLEMPGRMVRLGQLGLPFAIGVGLYLMRHRVPLSPALALGLAGLAALAHGTALFGPLLVAALSYGAFVLGYARRAPGALRYNRLGDYSYGVYIYAFPVQQAVAWAGVDSPAGNIALALPVTLVLAVLSWHLVEAPALQLKPRGASGQRRPQMSLPQPGPARRAPLPGLAPLPPVSPAYGRWQGPGGEAHGAGARPEPQRAPGRSILPG